MLAKALQGGTSAAKTYVDDVFSTYLYNGNGSTQTITNGIDLAGQGGLVWIKRRDLGPTDNKLVDTVRGATKPLLSQSTQAEVTEATGLTAFTSSGFSLGTGSGYNSNGGIFTSWTFRKAPKFFDVVTYTGNGTSQTIAHSLGQVPGCIIVKRTDTTGGWYVYHRSLGADKELLLNQTTAAATDLSDWNNTSPTASVFSVGATSGTNANGGTYVAYLFAHDTAADGLIQCGTYTGNGASSQTITLGWEPQFIISKMTNNDGSESAAAQSWRIVDIMRGMPVGADNSRLQANNTDAENNSIDSFLYSPQPTGFRVESQANTSGKTYIYIAIRRPNKPPTTGTQVFQPTVYTGTNVDNRLVDTTIAPDMVWVRQRNDSVLAGMVVGDRLRGQPYLLTGSTAAEVNDADSFDAQSVSAVEYGTAFSAMNGFWCGNDATAKLNANTTSNNHIAEAFKRAPGFFDVVCYTGTGSATTVAHNLGAVPELMIAKNRSTLASTNEWIVYHSALGATKAVKLNETTVADTDSAYWNNTAPTTTQFTLGASYSKSGTTYVAYLFASLPGISKVGSYTGNGTSQTINCGFSAGARFVLIKTSSDGGHWNVWDSARGIVAGNDTYLMLSSTGGDVTIYDDIDADSTGFIVNNVPAGGNVNSNGVTYIYLAIA